MRKAFSHWVGWTVSLVVIADWFTKFLVLNQMHLYQKISVIGDWLYLVHLHNEGIAFSLLDGGGRIKTYLLIALAAFVVIYMARMVGTITDKRQRFAIALIMGGALGNLGDRALDGGVTDFIAVRYFPYVFNVADMAVTIGAIVLALAILKPQAPEIAAS